MGKYKICVYAISKNEEKYAEKWFNSMKEADEIYVLDTGSTDNTVNILKNLGAHVETKIISPWRFDVARNLCLGKSYADINKITGASTATICRVSKCIGVDGRCYRGKYGVPILCIWFEPELRF